MSWKFWGSRSENEEPVKIFTFIPKPDITALELAIIVINYWSSRGGHMRVLQGFVNSAPKEIARHFAVIEPDKQED